MTLRCKPDDLAVIVKSNAWNTGKIVKVLRLHTSQTHDLSGIPMYHPLGPRWVIETPIESLDSNGLKTMLYTVSDCNLRPIRGQEGQDETLTWLDVPSEVTA